MADKLKSGLSKLIVRKKLDGGEFAYLIKSTGKEIAGKKLAFMLLKNDAGFGSFKTNNKTSGESDEDFEARVLKLLPTVPFGGGTVVAPAASQENSPKPSPKVQPKAATPKKAQTPNKPQPAKNYEKLTKDALHRVIARRKLEGGEFTYVYRPLDKAVAGKKTVYNFLKNQHAEYAKILKTKNPSETEKDFETRTLQLLSGVPFETELSPAGSVSEATSSSSSPAVSKAGKRKSQLKGSVAPKRAKLDLTGSTRAVYVDVAVFSSQDIPSQLVQLGAVEDKPNHPKKFFRAIKHSKFDKYAEGTLGKLNMRDSLKEGMVFKKHNFDTKCSVEVKAISAWLSFLETVKNNFKNLVLVIYRREALYHLLKTIETGQQHGFIRRFVACVTSIVCVEDLIEEGDLAEHGPLKHIKKLHAKVLGDNQASHGGKNDCAEDYAEQLMNVMVRVESEWADKTLAEMGEGSNDCFQRYVRKGAYTPDLKIPAQMFSVTHSQNFLSNERHALETKEASTASTSKKNSLPPPKPQQAQIPKKVVKKPEVMEVEEEEEEEEDPNSFSTVGSETVFPVLCQPILVRLGEVDENTKFVKFALNKEYQAIAEKKGWELLPTSSKVFWKSERPFAFCHIYPTDTSDKRYKSGNVKPIDKLGVGTVLGTFRSLNKTDEEQRYLSTKVSVDLQVLQSATVNSGKVGVVVKAVVKDGSLTSGKAEDFIIRPSDALIVTKCNLGGVEFVNNLVSVDKKPVVQNRAKVLLTSTSGGNKELKEGKIIGQAVLFQNDVKLLFSKMAEQGEISIASEPSTVTDGGVGKVPAKQMKRPLKTVGGSRLYAQGSNPLLVKLDQYQATKLSSKFNKACIKFSPEFSQVIDKNKNALKIEKLKEKDSVVKVYWKGNAPFAFVDVKISPNRGKNNVDFCDIIPNYDLGLYAPMDYCKEPAPVERINMMVCVDFMEKNVVVDNYPKLVKVYLKFKDAEVDKEKVLEECFSISRVWHTKLDVLSVVFKPDNTARLAPQKTSTNDMKAVIVVKTKPDVEGPVNLNPREVLAECCSFIPDENLKRFSVSGRKVQVSEQAEPLDYNDDYSDGRRQMTPASRMSMMMDNPMEDDYYGERQRPRARRPQADSHIHNPFEDVDMDYVSYGGAGMKRGGMGMSMGPMNGMGGMGMGMSMGSGMGGMGSMNPMSGMGGGMGPQGFSRGGSRGGGVKSRLGGKPAGMQGRGGNQSESRNDLFQQARQKLNNSSVGRGGGGSTGGPGSFRGAQGPPKRGTWSS